MASALRASLSGGLRTGRARVPGWGPLLAGALVMYVPTYLMLARSLWGSEEQGHGPIVLGVASWAIWHRRHALAALDAQPRTGAGSALLGFGLLLYVLGRSQDIIMFEVGSQIPVLAGVLLLMLGPAAVRVLWFPLVYLAFMVPLPGSVVDAMTSPLRQHISMLAEQLLYTLGYPVARTGVVLSVGPYQLLVADACSGLRSMYALLAVGLVYLYLRGYRSRLRNVLLVTAMLPIAFLANLVRVMTLILVTYHLGDAAGQGFMHDFAGFLLFGVALALVLAVDAALRLAPWSRPERA